MESKQTYRKPSRRDVLRGLGVAASALIAGPALAACAPVATPGGGGGDQAAAEGGGPVEMELWTFVNTHARWFQSMAEDYVQQVNPEFNLTVTEIAYDDMHDKLQIALQAGGVGAPDISDIEQGRFGGFLRGGNPGLVDLTDRLQDGGYMDQLVASREALYTYQGNTYGIEHALTPVVLYYRHDVWAEAGLDPATFETWDDFIAGAQQVVNEDVKAINFPGHDVLLRQRGSDYFDAEGNVTLDATESIETARWILDLRDLHGIADQGPADDAWWAALKEGRFLSVIGADWYAGFLKDNAPELEGAWMAAPLPAWEPGGLRTSCAGGTGACITQFGEHIEEAWNFLEFAMLSVEGNVRRFEMTNLFPPYIPAMDDERLHQSDAYFNGQDLGAVFAAVGPDVPAQYQSPYRAELNIKLTPLWQEIYDGIRTPDEIFVEIAEEIRTVIAEEQP